MISKMTVKFKKLHPNAVIPSYAKTGDAGLDMTAVSVSYDEKYGFFEYVTGIAAEIPYGFAGLLFPRSSISKYDLFVCNSIGLIDSGYRGQICFRMKPTQTENFPTVYQVGDRIGQLVIIPFPQIEPVESDELSDSERGSGGYGSSGQ